MRTWTLKTVLGVLGDFVSNPTKARQAERARSRAAKLQALGNFLQAAEAYAECLSFHPRRRGVWVQRGNCLKDGGDYNGARSAYEQALSLNAAEPDVFIQMAHLAKAMGDQSLSDLYYSRAIEIDPRCTAALGRFHEMNPLAYLRKRHVRQLTIASRVYALDLTDLLLFLHDNTRVTGIQRVQCALVQELLGTNRNVSIIAVYLEGIRGQLCMLDDGMILDLLKTVSLGDASQGDIVRKIGKMSRLGVPFLLRRNDVFMSLGAFWNLRLYSKTLSELKRGGALIGVYIYDVIPITHPHFFVRNTQKDFIAGFDTAMRLFDFGLAISEYTAAEASRLVKERLGRVLNFRAVPLAHELPRIRHKNGSTTIHTEIPERFVLCVCTLEVRKNHILLFEIWSRLVAKHGLEIPSLILVGKIGWKVEYLMQSLSISNNVSGKIVLIQGASDFDLAQLYKDCLFTIFPSFAEGWGLPVGESLSYGKPCIASKSTSIPEVGGALVRYLDPFDVDGAELLVQRAVFDTDYLEEWTQQIKNEFVMRRWDEVAQNFIFQIDEALASPELKFADEFEHDGAASI